MSSQTLSFKQLVKTSPENAYRAFTNATDLRRWLCNVATVVPRPGGRLYMWWNSGYYTSGEFKIAENFRGICPCCNSKISPCEEQLLRCGPGWLFRRLVMPATGRSRSCVQEYREYPCPGGREDELVIPSPFQKGIHNFASNERCCSERARFC